MTIAKGVIIKSAAALITIGGAVSTGVVLHKTGQFESARNVLIKGRIWGLNGEDKFGIPGSCGSKGCELNEEKLKKIKFKELEGSSGEFSFEGLKDGKIRLWMEGNRYVFGNSENEEEVKIKRGEKTLTLAKKTDSYFRGEKGHLVFVETKLDIERKNRVKEVNGELERLGLNGLKLTIQDFEEDSIVFKKKGKDFDLNGLKGIQFSELNGKVTKITGLDSGVKIKLELQYNAEETKYPKNMKFVFVNNTNYNTQLYDAYNNSIKIMNTTSAKGKEEVFRNRDGRLERVK